MAKYFDQTNREWVQIYPGIFVSDLHRYPTGGGAALFRMDAGARMSEHDHPTGEHGYVIEGEGDFGGRKLVAGDAFWMEVGEKYSINAITDLMFFATSLPKPERSKQNL